ncbi:hypothetical protein QUC31_005858 [Theobroma cacao]
MPWEIVLAGVVGKALLSASLRLLFDKMASRKVLDFFREKKLDHHSLQTLKFKLLAVNSVLNDAEEQQHIMNLSVQEWLDELKDALYEAEDLFAEITSEVVKSDMEAGYQTPKEQVEALNTALRKIVDRVTETIYESAVLMHSNAKDLNVLQVTLGRVLMGRKFLLVLDDMWNDSLTDWDLLQRPFHFGAGGSKIIVTTRNQSVSSTMHSVLVRSLTPLPYEDCWSIFAKHAFGSEYLTDGDSALESIGKKIVEKCQGLPLAAKAVGGLLHSKVEPKEWDDVLNSKLWDLPSGEFTFKLEDESLPLNPERVRHLSCIPNRDEAPDKFEAFYEDLMIKGTPMIEEGTC